MKADIGVVAGSGVVLDALLNSVEARVPFAEVPGLHASTVSGHAGGFVFGSCLGKNVVLQSGRLHIYEGLPLEAVTATVDALASYGVHAIVFTNAAGGLKESMAPGDLMAATKIVRMPCHRWEYRLGALHPTIRLSGCDHEGVYLWVHGPSYETRAEIRALQQLGGHAVGMSTAPEIQRCEELGIQTAAISCITNNCCTPIRLIHEHVVQTAGQASARLVKTIRTAIKDGSLS